MSCHSKNKQITPEADNHCFAQWAMLYEHDFLAMGYTDLLLIGEWAGKGINSGDAICTSPIKQWHVFLAVLDGVVLYEPFMLDLILQYCNGNAKTIAWLDEATTYTFDDDFAKLVDDTFVLQCPYAKSLGLKGSGEGIVAYPIIANAKFEQYTKLMFKAKTKTKTICIV